MVYTSCVARYRKDEEKKLRCNFTLSPHSFQRLQQAAESERYSNSELVELAINEKIDRMEAERGKPFPSRD